MIDPTPNEKAAMEHGGQMGGEYLESVRATEKRIEKAERIAKQMRQPPIAGRLLPTR